jgi:hypothetical protein
MQLTFITVLDNLLPCGQKTILAQLGEFSPTGPLLQRYA